MTAKTSSVNGAVPMATNYVTNLQPTSGLDFKAAADRNEHDLFNILLHSLTIYPRTIPNVIEMHVQGT